MKQGNFGSNFSNDMAESVKLADYTSSDHEANTRKQFMKYASGNNRDQYQVSEQKDKNQIKFQMQGIKNIKTQQSQVSGIETGFKKLKGNKVQILKQLRSEFDAIRNIPINNQRKQQEQKMSSSSSHSRHSGPHQDNSSSSIESEKVVKKDANQRQERLWQLQRKQYEFMLNNCQQKIQQLLHNEMQYKKTIHDFKSASLFTKNQGTENTKAEADKQLTRLLKQQKEKNIKLTAELDKLKFSSKQQIQKIAKLQAEISLRPKDQYKYNDERRRFQELLRVEKDRFLNCEIQRRKFQMQNQLLLKEKQQQNVRVQKNIDHLNVVNQLFVKSTTKKYEDEIEIKDRRYMLLLSEFEKLKKEHTNTKAESAKPSSQNQMLELFKKIIQDKKSNSPNQELTKTTKIIMDKLQKMDQYQYQSKRPASRSSSSSSSKSSSSSSSSSEQENQHIQRLISEIKMLKAEIKALQNSGQGIDLEPMKKMYQAETAALKDTIAILERKLKNMPKGDSLPSIDTHHKSTKEKEKQIVQLQRRIRQLEQSRTNKAQNSYSIQQHEQIVLRQKRKVEQIQTELLNDRRKRNEVQFELSKLRKEFQFQTSILNNQKDSLLRVKQSEIDRANTNINYWRTQFENMRRFYEQKIAQKNKLLEKAMNSPEITIIKKTYEESMDKARLDYERQVKELAERLSTYRTNSLDYDTLFKKHTQLEVAYFDLQKALFRSKQSNDGVDHLWQIKQTEYVNINQILWQLGTRKNNNQNGVSNATILNNQTGNNNVNPGGSLLTPALGNAILQQGFIRNSGVNQPQTNSNFQRTNSIPQNMGLNNSMGGTGTYNSFDDYGQANSNNYTGGRPASNQFGGETVTYTQNNYNNSYNQSQPRNSLNQLGQTVTYDQRNSLSGYNNNNYSSPATYNPSGSAPVPYDNRNSNTGGNFILSDNANTVIDPRARDTVYSRGNSFGSQNQANLVY